MKRPQRESTRQLLERVLLWSEPHANQEMHGGFTFAYLAGNQYVLSLVQQVLDFPSAEQSAVFEAVRVYTYTGAGPVLSDASAALAEAVVRARAR